MANPETYESSKRFWRLLRHLDRLKVVLTILITFRTPESSETLAETSETTWRLPDGSRDFWRFFEAYGAFWRHLNSCGLRRVFTKNDVAWRILERSEHYFLKQFSRLRTQIAFWRVQISLISCGLQKQRLLNLSEKNRNLLVPPKNSPTANHMMGQRSPDLRHFLPPSFSSLLMSAKITEDELRKFRNWRWPLHGGHTLVQYRKVHKNTHSICLSISFSLRQPAASK